MSRMVDQLNRTLHVVLEDGREVSGTLLSFDKYMNLVLAEAKESTRKGGQVAVRDIGLLVIRGERVVTVRGEAVARRKPDTAE